MFRVILATVLGLASVGCAHQSAGDVQHWGYGGEYGAENWAALNPGYAACNGVNQSPIDLGHFIEAELPALDLKYLAGGYEILNNGHTIQVNYRSGSGLEVDGQSFELKQFHFHAPSENHILGEPFPMEIHLVHQDGAGDLAVVALMVKAGEPHGLLESVWSVMPQGSGEKNALPKTVSVEKLLPSSRDYYRFNGSLTTPPCSEGVRWLVLKEPINASEAQIHAFAQVMGFPNNRPLQQVNARPILE